ncbi:MAG: helix-turn-helix domain-containing protein [Syntrophomonadaceae bacterium]|jgi:transcriptional regulator with XRE-family HTH domain|nr:helix-turn-helix domain-containing protein [Syntrophomonadaceae bacterium]
MDNVQRSIAQKIKNLRKKAGISQTKLAEKCNVSKSMISKIESNKATIHLDLLLNIARVLEVSLYELLEESSLITKKKATVVRERERKRLVAGVPGKSGYKYYGMAGSHEIDTFLLVIGKEAIQAMRFVTHDGYEFFYVVEGGVRLQFRDEEYKLYNGDTAFFNATQEHRLLPTSDEGAQVIVVFMHP